MNLQWGHRCKDSHKITPGEHVVVTFDRRVAAIGSAEVTYHQTQPNTQLRCNSNCNIVYECLVMLFLFDFILDGICA